MCLMTEGQPKKDKRGEKNKYTYKDKDLTLNYLSRKEVYWGIKLKVLKCLLLQSKLKGL